MMPLFSLHYTDTFKRDAKQLGAESQRHLAKLIPKILENPTRFKQLKGRPNYYRIRLESYRLIYSVEGKAVVFQLVRKRDIAYRSV